MSSKKWFVGCLWILSGIVCGEENTLPPYSFTIVQLEESLGVKRENPLPEKGIRIVYFHRQPGCATCQKMARYLYETVKESFAEEAASKKIILRYLSLENPKYAGIAKALRVSGPALFLLEWKGEKDVRARPLSQIWALAGDKKKFQDYLKKEIQAMLEEGRKG